MIMAAVVLNFNDSQATLACVDSIQHVGQLNTLYVVDNGSGDDEWLQLKEALRTRDLGHLRLLRSDKNLGFGAGMNYGIEASLAGGADRVLLLNNDTLLDGDAVDALSFAMDADPSAGVAVPLVTTGDGDVIWAAGGDVSPSTLGVSHRLAGRPVGCATESCEVNFAPGAALLVDSNVFRDLGGFVESLFLYMEDVEFSLRVVDAGYRILFVHDAYVWHAVQGGSSSRGVRSIFFRTRNTLWLTRHRYSGVWRVRVLLATVWRMAVAVARRSRADPRLLKPYLVEYCRGLLAGLGGDCVSRRLEPRRFSRDH